MPKICLTHYLVYADRFSFCPHCGNRLVNYQGNFDFRSNVDYNNYLLEKMLAEIQEPNTYFFKFVRSTWNAGRDIIAALIGGILGALIALYITHQNFNLYLAIVLMVVLFFGLLFVIYWFAKKELAL
jgi:hypothetical protein